MAFQAGTQVDPRLMQADYSGFARAAEIQAQGMANLGEQIGNAITKYAVNKQKKEDKKLRYESILPYTTSVFGAEEGDALAKQIANDPASSKAILDMVKMSQEAIPFEPRSRKIGGVTYVETEPDKFERLKEDKGLTPSDVTALSKLMERPEFDDIKFDETTGEAYMEVPNKETLRPFDKKRVPVPQEIQQLPGFDQFSRMRRTATAPRDYSQMGMRVVK